MKNKNKQIAKEAKITILLYLIYFVWWYGFAYGLGDRDPSEYKFIFGLPDWFFYSCVLGFLMISTLVAVVVKIFFKDIDFN